MMGQQPPRLRRGFFGYSRPSVRRMLADRDSMYATARARLNETQARVGQLEAQLTTLEQHLNLRNTEVETAAQQIAQLQLELDGARERLREAEPLAGELAEAREALSQMDALSGELAEAREQLQDRDRIEEELREARGRIDEVLGELEQARRQLREHETNAEARVASVEAQLASTRSELEHRAQAAEARATRAETELAAARAELSATPEPVETSEQISAIIEASERAATRIIDLAGRTQREQAEEVDRMRERVRAEADRISTWRQQLEPVVQTIRLSIERARARIDDIPDRIRDALSPLGEAIDSVNEQFNDLVEGAQEQGPEEGPREESPAATQQQRGEAARDEHASRIRAIRLGERETAPAGDADEEPGARPGWENQ